MIFRAFDQLTLQRLYMFSIQLNPFPVSVCYLVTSIFFRLL